MGAENPSKWEIAAGTVEGYCKQWGTHPEADEITYVLRCCHEAIRDNRTIEELTDEIARYFMELFGATPVDFDRDESPEPPAAADEVEDPE